MCVCVWYEGVRRECVGVVGVCVRESVCGGVVCEREIVCACGSVGCV